MELEIFDDLVFEFLRVLVAGLEIPDGGVEAIDAVERATGNIDGVAHAFAVGDDEGLVVGNHALGHAPAIPLTGFRIIGQAIGRYGGAASGLAGRKVMALGFGLGCHGHDSLLAENALAPAGGSCPSSNGLRVVNTIRMTTLSLAYARQLPPAGASINLT